MSIIQSNPSIISFNTSPIRTNILNEYDNRWMSAIESLYPKSTLTTLDYHIGSNAPVSSSVINGGTVPTRLNLSGKVQALHHIYGGEQIFNDNLFGLNVGTIMSNNVTGSIDTVIDNISKGAALTEGLGRNTAANLASTGVGLAGNLIGRGIVKGIGDNWGGRFLGQGVASTIGTVGGSAVTNLINGKSAFQGISEGINTLKNAKKAGDSLKSINAARGALGANIGSMAGQIVGSALSAANGPSREYNGRYGNITRGMDTAYDAILTAIGFVPGWGQIASGAMALNKGLSNIFGSTSGMTRQDAILGSAFMPAPIKWLNMAGARTTDTFHNLSWQNTEKTNSFMQNAFGNLGETFAKAREEAGKTYGTFSRNAYKNASGRINTANSAWNTILDLANLNLYQNIRAYDMSSINNQRYAQNIQGGWSPLARGKQGMKILNNATNHNIGMRLLSAAALIDNKQMILCNAHD